MPQFDAGVYSGQLFWLAVCFIIFNTVMIRWLIPRLQQSIALRKLRILDYQQETQTLQAETTALTNELDKRLSTAHHQALILVQEELAEIKALHKESLASYDHKLEKKLISYEAELTKQVQEAHQELKAASTRFAQQLSDKYFKKMDA